MTTLLDCLFYRFVALDWSLMLGLNCCNYFWGKLELLCCYKRVCKKEKHSATLQGAPPWALGRRLCTRARLIGVGLVSSMEACTGATGSSNANSNQCRQYTL
eukprot:1839484-Pleurochrysis_carterae.AAC.2